MFTLLILLNGLVFQKPIPFSWSAFQIVALVLIVIPLVILALLAYGLYKKYKKGGVIFNTPVNIGLISEILVIVCFSALPFLGEVVYSHKRYFQCC